MKKIFIFIAALFAVVACNPKVDFNELMEDDYITASIEFPDSDVRLYEVQTVMSNPANAEKNEILASSTIIQIGRDSVKQIDRTYHNSRIVEEVETLKSGIWLGDFEIKLDSIKYTLNDALAIARQYDSVPSEPFMTFRKPVAPPFRMQYIFGSKDTYYMTIDAITGEVNTFENSLHEEIFSAINSITTE